MVFIDFKNCLPTTKKIKPNRPPKQPKRIVYTTNTAYLDLTQLVEANLNLKICISGYLNQNPPYLNLIFFIPDKQDSIFAGYGYNLQVIFIYVCTC